MITLLATACTKDDDTIEIQPHDENAMMTIMHEMQASMMTLTPSNDPDNDFAMMMIKHHQGAINMSDLELESGDDPTMRQLAQEIKDAQIAEIAELEAFLQAHAPHAIVPEFSMQQMVNMQLSAKNVDLQIINGDTDEDFATLMIQHHSSAIDNSRLELQLGQEQAMKTLATSIIAAQESEIKQFQEWLLANR